MIASDSASVTVARFANESLSLEFSIRLTSNYSRLLNIVLISSLTQIACRSISRGQAAWP